MDPNANLEEMRRIAGRAERNEPEPNDHARICELVDALDDWLSRGGFLPAAWARGRK
jgi:hypothetical protein